MMHAGDSPDVYSSFVIVCRVGIIDVGVNQFDIGSNRPYPYGMTQSLTGDFRFCPSKS